jgi:hypothetical protein
MEPRHERGESRIRANPISINSLLNDIVPVMSIIVAGVPCVILVVVKK